MDELTGKPFKIDQRYERMQAISEERHGWWPRFVAGPGFLLLLALLLIVPLLLLFSVL